MDPVENGARHDLTRGFLRKNFWVMETQPGFVNWSPDNNALNKGEVRAMAWNAIGHGSEAVEYWQWRSALNGQEQYHGTLVGADGTPVPLYTEAQQIGQEFAKAAPVLEGTTVHAEVAVLNDYPSRWAITSLMSYYRPLHALVHSIDIVPETANLTGYKLVVAPALNVITPQAAHNLSEYVRGGGHLVLGQRSGMKDEDNGLWPQRQPGPLGELLGGRVAQFYALDSTVPVSGDWGTSETKVWAEQLETSAPDAKVLMRYGKSNGWLDGQPAAITRKVGRGSITYIGAALDGTAMQHAAAWMVGEAALAPSMPGIPSEVDVAIRSGRGKHVVILINYGETSQTVPLPHEMTDVLAGGQVRSVQLPRYGVAVLEEK